MRKAGRPSSGEWFHRPRAERREAARLEKFGVYFFKLKGPRNRAVKRRIKFSKKRLVQGPPIFTTNLRQAAELGKALSK